MKEDVKTLSIALLRVSSTKQGLAGDSPDRQREEIEKILPKYNTKVIKWIELVESASGEIQPATKAIDYCREHEEDIKYCFITYIDRFTRAGSYYYQNLKSQLAKYGVYLVDVAGVISVESKNSLDLFDRQYKWSVYNPSHVAEILEAEKAHDEIRTILTRLIGSEIRYARMGYWVNYAPDGYIIEKKDTDNGKRCILKPHPERSKYFLKMFELKIQGFANEEIVKEINALGYRSRRLNVRDSENKIRIVGHKGEKPLDVKQVNKFLQNPIYCLVGTHKWLDKPRIMHGEPIITIDMFNKANRGKITILEENGNISVLKGKIAERYIRKSKNVPLYAFKEYVMCPFCNLKFKGSASRGKMGILYPAYHCNRNHKYFRIPVKEMEETIYNFCKGIKFTEKFKKRFRTITLEELQKEYEADLQKSINKEKDVLRLKQEKQMIVDKIKILENPIVIKLMEEELAKIVRQLEPEKEERDFAELKEVTTEALLNHCKYYVEHLQDLLMGSSNPLQNAAFFGTIFEAPPTYQDLKSGTVKLAGIFNLNEAFKTSNSTIVSDQGLEP